MTRETPWSVIVVDAAIGSKDLVVPLKKLGLPVQLGHLDTGDVAFQGRGPAGSEVFIGVELKKIADLVASLQTGRLPLHQLPRMLRAYDHSWILVEGTWRHDDQGLVCSFSGHGVWHPLSKRMMADELEKRMLSLELSPSVNSGLYPHVRYTSSRRDTLRFLAALYRWWTDRDMDQHKTMLGIYRPPSLLPISQFRRTISTLPHIGFKKSKELEGCFAASLRWAFSASLEEWMTALGPKTGRDVHETIQGRKSL